MPDWTYEQGIAVPDQGSVEWWVRRLSRRLDVRLGYIQAPGEQRRTSPTRWDDYYRGRLNLALASEKWRAEFAARFPGYSANFMQLVVDKHRERLHVNGIRYGTDPGTDDDAWAWWSDNHLEQGSLTIHREALIKGSSYVLVWPNDAGVPEASIESALEVVVETAPGKPWQRVAALKRFLGEDDRLHAELFLPEGIYRFMSTQQSLEFSSTRWTPFVRWQREERDSESWPIPNRWGVVPVVPFVAKPDLYGEGSSKIEPVASNQDAINKFRVDAFVASEFASFRQRWVIGLDIPVDPVTKEPIEPFRTAVDRLWSVPPPHPDDPNPAEVRFGEFDITPLAPFYEAIEGEVQMMGAISRTPYHHLLPQSGQPPSGDSLHAAESGLVAEVVDSQVDFGGPHAEVIRLQYLQRGDPRATAPGLEVIWRDPEVQSEGEHIDALLKMRALNVPEVALWERMKGVTNTTIQRWQRLRTQEELEGRSRPPGLDDPLAALNIGRRNFAAGGGGGNAEPPG